jgi:diacylglycerol kinase family enzyme
MPPVRTVALIASPDAGRGRDAATIRERLEAAGAEVRAFEIDRLEAVAGSRPDRIVVAGGDGSVGPAANLAARLRVPLAAVPVGTANNFARAEGIPSDIDEASRIAARGERTRAVELGRAGDVPFVNLASAGLAPVAAQRAVRLKRLLGPAAYTVGATVAALTTAPVPCEVWARGERAFAGETWQVMVASSGAFGAGVRVEGTDTADGALDVVVLEAGPRTELIRRGWWMRQGRIATQPGAVYARAPVLDVQVPDGTAFNVDGEVLELGPTRFTVERAAFQLVIA